MPRGLPCKPELAGTANLGPPQYSSVGSAYGDAALRQQSVRYALLVQQMNDRVAQGPAAGGRKANAFHNSFPVGHDNNTISVR